MRGTVDRTEIARFDALAAEWWDERGPMAPLHALTRVRMRWTRDRICAAAGREPGDPSALAGLDVLDVGCGGGLMSEPLARLGATVTGVDMAGEALAAARVHAATQGLSIDYRETTAEDLAAGGHSYDVVVAFEIVEHVADVDFFLETVAGLVRPGGILLLSTLNRTVRSLLLAKIGAEYVLRWLPRGTHDWRRFPKPSELARPLRRKGMTVVDVAGVTYDPVGGTWQASRDVAVNYFLAATRPPIPGRSGGDRPL